MLSIGELAQRTGVSKRMLRHWEEVGLLTPTEVELRTGRRRYAERQAGRVRAIAALRATGFGLDVIADLLASGLTEERLVALLREQEEQLAAEITEASSRLHEVRVRLHSIERGRHVMLSTLELVSLPERRIVGFSEDVVDETEIADAVRRLLRQLNLTTDDGRTLVLSYDGTTNPHIITVSAGLLDHSTVEPPTSSKEITLPGAETAAVATYSERPASVADAWILLDAELGRRRLRTTGPYRQTVHADGSMTLAAQVIPRDQCPPDPVDHL